MQRQLDPPRSSDTTRLTSESALQIWGLSLTPQPRRHMCSHLARDKSSFQFAFTPRSRSTIPASPTSHTHRDIWPSRSCDILRHTEDFSPILGLTGTPNPDDLTPPALQEKSLSGLQLDPRADSMLQHYPPDSI